MNKKKIIFISGLSGAGLKTAINCLDDSGVYCIDNLPLSVIPVTLEQIKKQGRPYEQGIAFCIRFLTEEHIAEFKKMNDQLQDEYQTDLMFLTADTKVLEQRYTTSRRKHPFYKEGEKIHDVIRREKDLLYPNKDYFDVVIDTSIINPQQLARTIENRYKEQITHRKMYVSFVSFGFKHGFYRPSESIFDVRFLPNPYFDPVLKTKTGLDQEVQDYVFKHHEADEMIKKLIEWHEWCLPLYYGEGKHYFRVGIGCTGGQHRSVSIVERLYAYFSEHKIEHIIFTKAHRDLEHRAIT